MRIHRQSFYRTYEGLKLFSEIKNFFSGMTSFYRT